MSLADLGRRAVACKHWRWMPGMRIVNPQLTAFGYGRKAAARYCTLGINDEAFILESKNAGSMDTPSKNEEDWHPDLEDPATLGCLLALVREACRYPMACAEYDACDEHPWSVYACSFWFNGDSEAEVLVAALEAAP